MHNSCTNMTTMNLKTSIVKKALPRCILESTAKTAMSCCHSSKHSACILREQLFIYFLLSNCVSNECIDRTKHYELFIQLLLCLRP